MDRHDSLNRFIKAQEGAYERALAEVGQGRKTGHWMWFIFPQIAGLGQTETSRLYALKDLDEATRYLHHPVLGQRLLRISEALLLVGPNDPVRVFGHTDSLKLRSSMTLFSRVKEAPPVFEQVLDRFFGGLPDSRTLQILEAQQG